MSESLLGVIIGAVAAILGGILGELLKLYSVNKHEKKDKIREAYEAVSRFIFFSRTHENVKPDNLTKALEDLSINLSLYLKKEARDLIKRYRDLFLDFENRDKNEKELESIGHELYEFMKKDLGFVD